MADTRRIQFEFSPQVVQRLDAMRQRLGRSSYAEIVRDGLRLLEWYEAQIAQGYAIGLVKDDILVKTVRIDFGH